MIELRGVSKTYGKKDSAFTALRNVELTIPSGATVAIVGKSGSGKSTLMHIMSGLDRPSEGSVIVDKRNLHTMKPKVMDQFRATEVGFIFQSFFVEAKQTCYYNVTLPLEIKGVGVAQRRKLAQQALEKVELLDKIDARARDLSGGQKQRLAIARAIVNKPQYIFADEPTGNLDSVTGEKIIDLLFDLNKELGSTLCIVTHDHELADRCQLQITLKDGEITKIGKAKPAKKGRR